MDHLFSGLTRKRADELSLLLTSEGIAHTKKNRQGIFSIEIEESLLSEAQGLVALFDMENRHQEPQTVWRLTPSWSGLFASLAIFAVFLKTGPLQGYEPAVRLSAASSSRILSGELFRTVTALFLHSGWPHLLGNMAGLIIFATGVFQISGDGVGWLLLLAASILANWVNALWFVGMGHIAFGASTLVFAAAGLLASAGTIRRLVYGGVNWRAFLPLGAGISILTLSGVGPGSDVTGHLLGFAFGALFGIIPGALPRKPGSKIQMVGLLTSAILCSAAFLVGGRGVF